MNSTLKALLTATGALTGYITVRFSLLVNGVYSASIRNIVGALAGILLSVVFYFSACEIIKALEKFFNRAEKFITGLTLSEIGVCSVGIVAGLAVSYFITQPFVNVRWIGLPLTIIVNFFLAFLGFSLTFWKRNDMSNARGMDKRFGNSPKLLDTSVIIDGRISEILRTGFIEGELVVPEFILVELRHIADSRDSLKRNRGRRGLDILNYIQNELGYQVTIEKCDLPSGTEVDAELVNLAKRKDYDILTTDYNLNKVASFQGVRVLNINELNNAIKPLAMPGEELVVEIIRDGKESGQGVAYLPDGTMIVVESGKYYIGEIIPVVLTSVLQTAAGRMVFARPKSEMSRNSETFKNGDIAYRKDYVMSGNGEYRKGYASGADNPDNGRNDEKVVRKGSRNSRTDKTVIRL